MKDFKFLSEEENDDNDYEPIPDNVASWIWADTNIISNVTKFVSGYHWEIEEVTTRGILEFLSRFDDYTIVNMISITANGIRHINDTGRGWGFDIRNDVITFQYYKLVPNETV